jgi:MATE family multidrug resistance protein
VDQPLATRGPPHQLARSYREELAGLFRLAGPIAAAQAGLALMGVTDTVVVGRLGAVPLSAVGLGNGLFLALAILGVGVMMGFDPLFAQALGAGREDGARRTYAQAVWMAALCTLLLAPPLILLPLLVERTGVEHQIARGACVFVWSRLPGLFPMLLFVGARSFLQAQGRVRAVVASTVVANIANLLLDLLLVYGWGPVPAMGVFGAGLATSLCSVAQFLVLQLDLREAPADRERRRSVQRTQRRLPPGPDRAELLRALRIGLPFGLQLGAEIGIFSLVGLLAARLGTLSVAAHQVALALASFTFCFALGIGGAGSVRVGWAVGAGDGPAARRSGLCAFAGGGLVMALSAVCLLLFREQLAQLVSGSPEVVRAAAPLVAVTAVFQLADGTQAVGAGVLRGAGDTRAAFVANLIGHWVVGLPVGLLLGYRLGLGVIGLWWGLCAGLSVVAAALLLRFLRLSARGVRPV